MGQRTAIGPASRALFALAMATLWPSGAGAHTSYLNPNLFSTVAAERITIEASFTEDFLRPEFAVDAQDFHLYRPDGSRGAYDNIVPLSQMTVLESDLTEPGTYRFTTGERLGRTGRLARIDGLWRPLEPGSEPPPDAEIRPSQTATVADVYVSKGAPTTAVLDVEIGRLAIRPLTHPSEIYLGEGFSFHVLFDGAALPNQVVHLYRDGGSYDETPFEQVLHTDANGVVALSFDMPGIYLVMTRFGAEAPTGAETPLRSYTTSLTFEVVR